MSLPRATTAVRYPAAIADQCRRPNAGVGVCPAPANHGAHRCAKWQGHGRHHRCACGKMWRSERA